MQIRILVVDDDPVILKLIGQLLGKENHVEVAANQVSALTLLKTKPFDLVICDILLGDVNGLDFFEKCQRMGMSVPFIMMSGSADQQRVLRALRLGALDLIEKTSLGAYLKKDLIKHLNACELRKDVDHSFTEIRDMIGAGEGEDLGFVREYLALTASKKISKRSA